MDTVNITPHLITTEDGTHSGITLATMITIPRKFVVMAITITINQDTMIIIKQVTGIVATAIDRNSLVL